MSPLVLIELLHVNMLSLMMHDAKEAHVRIEESSTENPLNIGIDLDSHLLIKRKFSFTAT